MFQKFIVAVPLVALAIGGSTACASKKFVRTSVGEVNEKVDAQGRSIEETQERTRKNEGRITEVDAKAAAADSRAQAANAAAAAAHSAATAVGTEANTKFDAIDKASKRLVYEVVLSEDQGNFKFGKTILPDEAKTKIDEMVAQMKQDPKNIYLEIEGHTDSVGTAEYNLSLGERRANAVRDYLLNRGVAAARLRTVSYGEERPKADNNTAEGRAMNRRASFVTMTLQ